jgi:hypothetical protein
MRFWTSIFGRFNVMDPRQAKMLPEWHSSHTKEGALLDGEMLPHRHSSLWTPKKRRGDWISRRWESRHQGKEWTIEGGGCWMDSTQIGLPLMSLSSTNHPQQTYSPSNFHSKPSRRFLSMSLQSIPFIHPRGNTSPGIFPHSSKFPFPVMDGESGD